MNSCIEITKEEHKWDSDFKLKYCGYAYDWELENENYVWINDMDRETNEIATQWMPLPEPPKESNCLEK